MAKEFEFDTASQRYRVTSGPGKGRFISYDAIANLTEEYIEQSKIEIDDLTNSLLNRSMSVSQWERGVAEQLKSAHINSYALGHGGIGRLGQDERSQISARLWDEFHYLRGFSEDIADGKLSEAQILDRSSMYMDSLHRSFEMGREASHNQEGFDEERRIVNASESCPDCINFEAQGWQPIGTLPHPGNESQCLSRCRCHKEYRKSEGTQSRLLQGSGWLNTKRTNKAMDKNIQPQNSPIKNVGVPTDEQMMAINRHSPMGDLSADEVTTLAFYASNNLFQHGYGAWTVNALSNMGQMLVGRKFLLNHDWDDVKSSHGKIYDYQLLYSQNAPDEAMNQAGHREINDYIVGRGGYARLILHAYFENGTQILNDFRFGRLDDVSTGTLGDMKADYICPVCSERMGREVRFMEKDEDDLYICPHHIPTPMMLYFYGDDPEANFAPFYYQDLNQETGGHGVELSAVVIPNLPATGIITPEKIELVG